MDLKSMVKEVEVLTKEIAKAFNIKSFEQLENENKSLRGQIKKQASVIKELRAVRKNDFYLEVIERKNKSLNDKLIHQSNIIGELMEFKKLYQDGIFVKTSPEQVGIVTIAQDELNNLRAFKKEISDILINKSAGVTSYNKIINVFKKYNGGV